jgi:hypothetical protein
MTLPSQGHSLYIWPSRTDVYDLCSKFDYEQDANSIVRMAWNDLNTPFTFMFNNGR